MSEYLKNVWRAFLSDLVPSHLIRSAGGKPKKPGKYMPHQGAKECARRKKTPEA